MNKKIKRYLSQRCTRVYTTKAGRTFSVYQCEVEYEDGTVETITEEKEDYDDMEPPFW